MTKVYSGYKNIAAAGKEVGISRFCAMGYLTLPDAKRDMIIVEASGERAAQFVNMDSFREWAYRRYPETRPTNN